GVGRRRAQRVAGTTGKPFNEPTTQKTPALRVALWRAPAVSPRSTVLPIRFSRGSWRTASPQRNAVDSIWSQLALASGEPSRPVPDHPAIAAEAPAVGRSWALAPCFAASCHAPSPDGVTCPVASCGDRARAPCADPATAHCKEPRRARAQRPDRRYAASAG